MNKSPLNEILSVEVNHDKAWIQKSSGGASIQKRKIRQSEREAQEKDKATL